MVRRFFLLVVMITIMGCLTATRGPITPDVEFNENLVGNKIPLKVAVLVDEAMANNLKRNCCYYKSIESGKYMKWVVWVNTPESSLKLFNDAFLNMFDEVEFIRGEKTGINYDIYDLTIQPTVSCELDINLTKKQKSDNWYDCKISSNVKYKLHIKTNSFEEFITANGTHSSLHDMTHVVYGNKLYPLGMNEYVGRNVGESIDKAFNDLIKKITGSEKLETFVQNKHYQQSLPAKLVLYPEFTDSGSILPNNTIDAGENSVIKVKIVNAGKGEAFDTSLNINTNNKHFKFKPAYHIGNILPGNSKTFND